MKQQVSVEKKEEDKIDDDETSAAQVQVEIIDEPEVKEVKEKKEEDDDVKDSWDAESTGDEQEEEGIVLCIDYIIIQSRDLSERL